MKVRSIEREKSNRKILPARLSFCIEIQSYFIRNARVDDKKCSRAVILGIECQ